MRGLTSTILATVVLIGLGAYIYVYEWGSPTATGAEKEKAFAALEADTIEELQIKSAAGETSRVRKGANGWELLEPAAADADETQLSAITSNLTSLEVQRVVDENPGDLAQYGLDPPRVDVSFRVKDAKEFRHLMIGEKTPTGGDLYAKLLDDKKVFLISSYLDSTFNRTPFDLRDKSILEFERDKVDSLEIANGPVRLQFVRSGSDWKIAKPIAARADYGSVEGLMSRLSSGEMQTIVDAEPKDLKRFGLANAAVTATVSAGSARASLAIGFTEGEATYAKDASRPMVFTVEPSLATDLKKGPGDFRRKDVFDFRSFSASRVEIRRGSDSFTFEKTKDKDGKEIWRNAAGDTADTTKVDDVLTRLSNLRAQSFEPTRPAALKTPELHVTVTFDEGKSESVQLGRAGADVLASRADEPGAAKLEPTPYDDVLKALEALK